jgi:hypothetical protein
MNTKILNAVAAALVAGLALSQPAAAGNTDDVVTCSAKTLRGVYDFRASGFVIANGVALP